MTFTESPGYVGSGQARAKRPRLFADYASKVLMPVYVDCLRDWGWRLGPSCHLISDCPAGDNEELHVFAARLGLKRSWFQTGLKPHYDLTAGKRALAVRLGAIELEDLPFHAILKRWQEDAGALVKAAASEAERQRVRAQLYG